MLLKKISVRGFRNFDEFDAAFEPGINIIAGKNGAGKTNLLEAVFVISTSTSQRTSNNQEMLNNGEGCYFLGAQVSRNGQNRGISASYSQGSGFEAKINGNTVNRKDLLEAFPVVIFSPEDVDVLKGPPAALRKVFNINIAQVYNSYVDDLIKYGKLLRGRNEILKSQVKKSGPGELKAWTTTMLRYAERIGRKRAQYTDLANSVIAEEVRASGLKKGIKINYCSSKYDPDASTGRDIERGYTTWGPHRDRFDFHYGGRPVRAYASRGETRTVSFIYRMATLSIIQEVTGCRPLVLLDDIFSELDADKRTIISERIKDMQSVITHTEVPGELKNNLSQVIKI